MRLRGIACCAALVLGLGLTAAPHAVCFGTRCGGDASAKPLDLGRFMRHPGAKAKSQAAKQRHTLRRSVAKRRRPAAAAPSPAQATLPAEAVAAYASQDVEPNPPVRVVPSEQFNEIDRAADPTPLETGVTPAAADNVVKVVDAAEFNEIDRMASESRPTSVETVARNRDNRSGSDHGGGSWLDRLWTALQGAFAAVVAGLRRLFG